jgi:single-strand DNA-binding protein
MNRVVLCDRLAGRPKIAYTPCGIAVATFRLMVPRPPAGGREAAADEMDCVAFRQQAIALHAWGERDIRVNLEGRLRLYDYRDEDGRAIRSLRIHVDHAYCAEPDPENPQANLRALPSEPAPAALAERAA